MKKTSRKVQGGALLCAVAAAALSVRLRKCDAAGCCPSSMQNAAARNTEQGRNCCRAECANTPKRLDAFRKCRRGSGAKIASNAEIIAEAAGGCTS